jgi:basic membrane protein A and related proteins
MGRTEEILEYGGNNMKKLLVTLLMLAMIFTMAGTFSACGGGGSSTYELALVTDIGTIDDKSFNQGAWEGLVKYATDNKITHKYYQPTEKTTEAYVEAIGLAVKGGAKVIVCPGYMFEIAVFQAQTLYPDTKFIILDGYPHESDTNYTEVIKSNVYSVFFKEDQAGFLAGYAAVKGGYTKLGFVGGIAVPAVIRYGYGFIQGADYAARELGVKSVAIKYHYSGGFAPTPEVETLAASWYNDGTQVIFAAAGGAGNSVMAAADAASKAVIGVDVDQSSQSKSVITSAMKALGTAVTDGLKAYYDNKFPGGTTVHLGADKMGIGLPMDSTKITGFTKADYDAIYAKLADGTVKVNDDTTKAPTFFNTSIVKVTVVK